MSDTTQLWAPWRAEYIKGEAPKIEGDALSPSKGCLFCYVSQTGAETHRENLVLTVRDFGFVMLNRYPYSGGHLMVSPLRHISSPEELSETEYDGLFRLVRVALVTLKGELRPHGVNVGMNLGAAAGAGIAAHLHVHLVPRWSNDANFMTSVAGVRVISEALYANYDALVDKFRNLA
jgi:ATP adenylyltransferase